MCWRSRRVSCRWCYAEYVQRKLTLLGLTLVVVALALWFVRVRGAGTAPIADDQAASAAQVKVPAAERWAREILECSPLSVQATKQAALEGLGKPYFDALAGDYPLVRALFRSEDFIEGPRAFAEKRKPHWKGR